MGKNPPNIKFLIEPEEDVSVYFYFEGEAKSFNRWSVMDDYFFKKHPKIKILKKIKSKKEKKIFLGKYVNSYYATNRQVIERGVQYAEKRWNGKKGRFSRLAGKLFPKHPWPKGNYQAFVTIWDIFPRNIAHKTFQIPFSGKWARAVETVIAHEMLHFLFYDYLYENFPQSRKGKNSYAVWVLSEAFNSAIMSEPTWPKFLPKQPQIYPETKNIVIKMKNLRKKNISIKEILEKLLPFIIENYQKPPSC